MAKDSKSKQARDRHEEIRACLAELKKTDAGQDILAFIDEMHASSLDLEAYIADYLRQKPFKTVGVALLTGIIIGYYLRSR